VSDAVSASADDFSLTILPVLFAVTRDPTRMPAAPPRDAT
jgi:hypothetical protein